MEQHSYSGVTGRHLQYLAQRYPAWYVELCAPVTLALTAYAWEQAEAGLAKAARAAGVVDPAVLPSLQLILATQRFFLTLHRDGPEQAREGWPGLLTLLSTPGQGRGYEALRVRQLLIHRCQAARFAWQPLSLEDAQALMAVLEPLERNQYLWHELSMQAYCAGWPALLQQAYSELSVSNDGLLSNWFYNHTRLMLRLSTGEALREDAAATLNAMGFASQVPDLLQTVWPVLLERGWLTATKLETLARRLALNPAIAGDGLLE